VNNNYPNLPNPNHPEKTEIMKREEYSEGKTLESAARQYQKRTVG